MLNLMWDIAYTAINAVVINTHPKLLDVKHGFEKKIKDTIGLSVEVNLVSPDAIPRSQGGKLSRIKDLRELG